MLTSEKDRPDIVIIGLSITSSWGNGHATTYRSLAKGLHALGQRILFLEHDVPWYARHRDFTGCTYAKIALYNSVDDLKISYGEIIRHADLVIVGSYVVQGVEVIDWVCKKAGGIKAFYDIDTPVTLAKLKAGDEEYLKKEQIPYFDLYLSFTGGPILEKLETEYHANAAKALYCSVDDTQYYPEKHDLRWDLGYMGTYSADRQPALQRLIIGPASQWPKGRFIVAGPQFPPDINWPDNVKYISHIPPDKHRQFYNRQRFTLNVTRQDMIGAGYAPSVRLFEAAACGIPIISDYWQGLDTLLKPESEILIAKNDRDVLGYLKTTDEDRRTTIGRNARQKILKRHTSVKRAEQLLEYFHEVKKDLRKKPIINQEYNAVDHDA